ncbi:MAG: general stress protein, partial [Candidatus Rokuibacteriota bacterium]
MSEKTRQTRERIAETAGVLTTDDRAENTAVVGIYRSHTEAEKSVKELQRSGFDMKKLSIVGKDYHTEEHVVGYYNTGDRMKV